MKTNASHEVCFYEDHGWWRWWLRERIGKTTRALAGSACGRRTERESRDDFALFTSGKMRAKEVKK